MFYLYIILSQHIKFKYVIESTKRLSVILFKRFKDGKMYDFPQNMDRSVDKFLNFATSTYESVCSLIILL